MQTSGVVAVVVATLVLVVAGGLIAYLGDRWGYALGKKRLSLLGMRPRKTASFLTVIAGAMISLFTFGVLLAVNAGFYTALTQGATQLRTNHMLKRENQALNATNQLLSAQIPSLKQQVGREQAQFENEASKYQYTAANLDKTTSSLNKAHADLTKANSDLASTRAQEVAMRQQVAADRRRVAALQQREQTLTRVARNLAVNIKLREGSTMLYTNGAEVGRTVIASTQPEKAVRSDLIDFLGNLSQRAKQEGASVGRNGRYVEVTSIKIGSSPTFAQENDSIDVLSDQIHAQGGGSVVVIAYALGNAFANKPVVIALRPFVNKLVIPAGTILGETVIPGPQKGVAEILADMQAFLRGPVHRAALHSGVIPVLPEDDIGGVGARQIDPAVAQIQQINGDAQVVALAAKDTYAADQVSLDFVVRSARAMPVSAHTARP